MSLLGAVESVLRSVNRLANALVRADDGDRLTAEEVLTHPGRPPVLSPAKKAERSWPTTEHRSDQAPIWPPFEGDPQPLGDAT